MISYYFQHRGNLMRADVYSGGLPTDLVCSIPKDYLEYRIADSKDKICLLGINNDGKIDFCFRIMTKEKFYDFIGTDTKYMEAIYELLNRFFTEASNIQRER